jgi:hypothetical protein
MGEGCWNHRGEHRRKSWGEREAVVSAYLRLMSIRHLAYRRMRVAKSALELTVVLAEQTPLPSPTVFRYFPPAVAKVYIVTVRAIFIHSFL